METTTVALWPFSQEAWYVFSTHTLFPVFLRKEGDYYLHVAPSYAAGITEGEAKELVERGEAEVQEFVIW